MNDRDFTVYLLVYPENDCVMFTDLLLSLYTIVQGANETKYTGSLAHIINWTDCESGQYRASKTTFRLKTKTGLVC